MFKYIFALMLSASVAAAQQQKDMEIVSNGNAKLAVSLYQELAKEEQGNLFFSPLSIQTALGMTYLGAEGKTREEMAKVLAISIGKERLEAAFAALLTQLNQESAGETGIKLQVVNSLWAEKTYPILESYKQRVAKSYGAELKAVDFIQAAELARQNINQWVSDATQKKIEDLIPQGVLTPETVLALVNAIYLKAGWSQPFEVEHTEAALFFVDATSTVRVPMMQQTAYFPYFEDKKVQVLELPYKGDTTSMILVLPKAKNGLAAVEKSMTTRSFGNYVRQVSKRTQNIAVSLPKFSITSQFELKKKLSALGMKDIFSPGTANLSGIDGTRNLFVSNVIHKTYIHVDEEGTEAAGATAVIIGRTGFVEPVLFRADHPFLFVIYHKATKSILFMGRVITPTVIYE